MIFSFLGLSWKRRRDENHYIMVEHVALMEYERNIYLFLENFVFVAKIYCFDVFLIIISLLDFNSKTNSK
jgi:hypothetical protein